MSDTTNHQEPPIERIQLEKLQKSPTNPRKTFNKERLGELVASVRERGVMSALWVRPRWCVGWQGGEQPEVKALSPYEIVAGERRYRAALLAERSDVPAQVYILSDQDALELQLIENLQREDLEPMEEAQGFQQMLEMKHPTTGEPLWTVDTLAERIKRTGRHVRLRLKLLNLPERAQEAMKSGELKPTLAVLIGRIPDEKLRERATDEILEGRFGAPMSLREAEEHIEEEYMKTTSGAVFDVADATLRPEAGPCTTCPHLAKNSKDFQIAAPGVAGVRGDMCLNPGCYALKEQAYFARFEAEQGGAGRKVLTPEQTERWVFNGKFSFHQSKIVPLAERPDTASFGRLPESAEGKTWAQLTAGQGAQVLVAWTKGGALEGMHLEKALAAAAANGHTIKNPLHRSGGTSSPTTKADREEAKRKQDLENKIQKAVQKGVIEQLGVKVKADPMTWLSHLAQNWIERLGLPERVARVTGGKPKAVRVELESGVPGRLCVAVAQCLYVGSIDHLGKVSTDGAKLLKTVGVDPAAIRKEIVKKEADAARAKALAEAAKAKKAPLKTAKVAPITSKSIARPKNIASLMLTSPIPTSVPNDSGVFAYALTFPIALPSPAQAAIRLAQSQDGKWAYGYDVGIKGVDEGCGNSCSGAHKRDLVATRWEAIIKALDICRKDLGDRRKFPAAKQAVAILNEIIHEVGEQKSKVPVPGTVVRANAPGAGKTKLAKAAGATPLSSLKDRINALLQAAGPAGAAVKDIAAELGVKNQNVHVWFSTTGKKDPLMRKVGEARYARQEPEESPPPPMSLNEQASVESDLCTAEMNSPEFEQALATAPEELLVNLLEGDNKLSQSRFEWIERQLYRLQGKPHPDFDEVPAPRPATPGTAETQREILELEAMNAIRGAGEAGIAVAALAKKIGYPEVDVRRWWGTEAKRMREAGIACSGGKFRAKEVEVAA